ncbi:blood vessel epicardial substance isoform X5 [Halyomorpha halys]|uniref:blood vessel epicardial substance isoform X5 n=1 Tax=Halyomorpha halys TaxID=286706 RepID=UPI0034D29F78
MTISLEGPGDANVTCTASWEPYQTAACALLLVGHAAPAGSAAGLLLLRLCAGAGAALSAWAALCSADRLFWNLALALVNALHALVLLYRLRPVRFSKEVEEVYEAVFEPLRVSRHQFKKVLSCMKMIRQLRYQEVYAQEKVTKVDSLSLVLSGKLVVSQNGRALHIVFPHQFLDSPEWFGVSTDEYFQVSETMSATKELNGHLGGGFEEAPPEEKPMLIVKKSGDGPGITALINRQLQVVRLCNVYCMPELEEREPLLDSGRLGACVGLVNSLFNNNIHSSNLISK